MNKHAKFGRLLAVARIARGLSRREVGERAQVDGRSLGRMERGERLPSVMAFARLHLVLGFSASAALDALAVSVMDVESGRPKSARLSITTGDGPRFSFGRALAWARVDAGLTQAAVARAVRCRRHHVAQLEVGRVMPSLMRLAQLRQLLGLDADRLLALLRGESVPALPFAGFGRVLLMARRARSMSRPDVADAARCELGLYHQFESGRRLPTMKAAVRIHEVLGFDANAALRSVWMSGTLERMS